ncbi:PIN domain-containing protein [Oscillatoria sp. FACHB-1406]|uniref:PIN domain-containing protein n=1 Tax=Oscillatoria sp. FACHB-1406 TaxID=2692846 RepID=UPI0016884883|nr:PIN domain-containing protein [Oscillatoria sp. FACHB-1406]MBD2578643.1 PIN domain-containing protein [Oscillatoria sp. FACHB-1406]
MNDLWVDANILLRLLTGEPPELAQRALRLVQRAERGEVTLRLSPMVVAEIIWVLSSFYRYSRTEIAEVLLPLIVAEGIIAEQAEQTIAAIERMAAVNVDFMDAFLAEVARKEGGAVASFDRDFRRLEIPWLEPE